MLILMLRTSCSRVILAFSLALLAATAQGAVSERLQRGIESDLASGLYQSAEIKGLELLERSVLKPEDAPALEALAAAFAQADMRDLAGALLSRAAELLDAPSTDTDRATLMRIGESLQALNLRSQAGQVLMRGIRITGKDKADAMNAAGYQSVGDLAFETGDLAAAQSAYESAEASLDANRFDARAALLSRQIKLATAQGDQPRAKILLETYRRVVADGGDFAGLGALQLQVVANALSLNDGSLASDLMAMVEQAKLLTRDDAMLAAEAAQLSAQIKALSGESESAITLLRQALVELGSEASPAQTYRVYWQIAKLQASEGNVEAALNNYRRSIANLSLVRGELLQGSTLVFTERVLPVYQGYIELLLSQAEQPGKEVSALSEVQKTLEDLSAAEILDYFDDNCVLPRDVMSLTGAPAGTAVIYPIVLGETGALLVRTAQGIFKFDFGLENDALESMVLAFRETITNPKTAQVDYEAQAQALYQALFGDADALLNQPSITTLVSVPSGYLRLLPISALHNGDGFLVNRYRLATTLGLQLTEQSRASIKSGSAFVGGVSDAVQGFESLPGVETELAELSSALSTTPLLNARFSLASVSKRLGSGNDSIVHLATHGYFDGDHANSFLLAHDDKITLDRLQSTVGARRFTGNSLDLLVLSACETAKGNERAALGLAGVSLKAGAKSTVASLWPIADAATAILMTRFYEALRDGESKASALQTAQQALLADPEWSHPAYWSPYLLIGNWG